ncbi:MAG: TonB-dependent receptor [Bacteroidia bacterium]|nr:TonB-dependent receptor [Bacteroidia bacterium]
MKFPGLPLIFTCWLFLSSISLLVAQPGNYTFLGTVVDADSRQPIEYATVRLKDSSSGADIAGVTTDAQGSFSLTSDKAEVVIEVSFIGAETLQITEFDVVNNRVDLGTMLLQSGEYSLDDVQITGERSSTEFQLDKRVFRVGSDLSSMGGSAFDVLNNVPSVNVSIEGTISLRGSAGVQILINGKPSVLTSEEGNALGTITADMIDRIEVITNPSAKYDAEGTSGIINIVLKKEERKGLNGSASLNLGWPHNHSFGLSVNRRSEKFNLFSQIGAGYRSLPEQNRNINQNLASNTTIASTGTEYRNEAFYNFILGTDYYINDLNVITLSGNFAYEVESQPSLTTFGQIDQAGDTLSKWVREEVTSATNPKWQYELQYKKDFRDDEDHALLFSALGSFFGKDQSSEFQNTTVFGNSFDGQQQTRTNFSENENTFKLDYTHPFAEKFTIETGSQYVINDVSNDYSVSDLVDGVWVVNDGLTNVFDWDQKVLGVYGTGAYEGTRWGLKLGLRAENTDLKTLLRNTNQSNDQNYTNLFPSAHSSYKFNERLSVQAGYSRRIFRPRLWDLNPFFNIRNNFNIRLGNPDLMPEFTDSYELAGIYTRNNFSMNMAVYHRFTTDVVERISTFDDGVTTVIPQNLGTNRATGIELNGKYSIGKWLSINGDANYNMFVRRGSFGSQSFDFEGQQYSGKLTSKFKLPADWDLEVTGQYQSRVKTVQGEQLDNLFADLGVRKKVMGGKGVVNLSVRDIFASRIRQTIVQQDDFYLYNWGRRGRFITVGFSYGFGKGEAMEYSGQRRR